MKLRSLSLHKAEETKKHLTSSQPTDRVVTACIVTVYNYILFTKLLWPGDSEGAFWSSRQASTSDLSTCLPHTNTWWRLHTVSLIAERQVAKL